MKKHIALILTLALIVCAFAGCAGTPVVYYTNCTCPTDGHAAVPEQTTGVPAQPANAQTIIASVRMSAMCFFMVIPPCIFVAFLS